MTILKGKCSGGNVNEKNCPGKFDINNILCKDCYNDAYSAIEELKKEKNE